MAKTMLEADRAEIARFVDAVFRHADEGTTVAMRTFAEGSDEALSTVRTTLNGDGLTAVVDTAVHQATKAANRERAAVFAPPVATFTGTRTRERDLANGLVVTVEVDHAPALAKRNLEFLVGPATVAVASGGQWIEPGSGATEDKLHLHWRCREPSRTSREHAALKRARRLACALVGADQTAVTLVHPLRWPGSWHRKGEPRLARIIDHRPDVEIDPEAVIDLLEPLVPPGSSGRRGAASSTGQLGDQDLAILGEIIANNDREWADWNRLGMAFFAASGGSDAGYAAFEAVSHKSAKHDADITRERWEHYRTSPPDRIGPGTLVYEARQVDPTFRLPSWRNGEASGGQDRMIPTALRISPDQIRTNRRRDGALD